MDSIKVHLLGYRAGWNLRSRSGGTNGKYSTQSCMYQVVDKLSFLKIFGLFIQSTNIHIVCSWCYSSNQGYSNE